MAPAAETRRFDVPTRATKGTFQAFFPRIGGLVHAMQSRVVMPSKTLSCVALAFTLVAAPRLARAETPVPLVGGIVSLHMFDEWAISVGPEVIVRAHLSDAAMLPGLGGFVTPRVVFPFSHEPQLFGAAGVSAAFLSGEAKVGWALRTGSEQRSTSSGFLGGIGHGFPAPIGSSSRSAGVMPFVGITLFAPLTGGEKRHRFSMSVDIGVRYLPEGFQAFPPNVIEGRPLRGGEGTEPELTPVADGAPLAARRWLAAARDEHASIATFGRLALELLDLGAEADLVRRAHAAALDEIRHAEACLRLASRHGAGQVTIARMPGVATVARAASWLTIAREGLVDGAINEGVAAARLRARARAAASAEERAILARIARDEARHARLGLDLVRDALRADPSSVRPWLEGLLAASTPEDERRGSRASDPLVRVRARALTAVRTMLHETTGTAQAA